MARQQRAGGDEEPGTGDAIVAGSRPQRWDFMFAEPPGGGLDWGTSSRLGPSLADYTGLGVTVGIIDDGFHLNLGELRDAFDTTRDRDLRDNDNNLALWSKVTLAPVPAKPLIL